MSEPEKIPDLESHMEERDGVTVVGAQIIGDVKVDTTVRPRDPALIGWRIIHRIRGINCKSTG